METDFMESFKRFMLLAIASFALNFASPASAQERANPKGMAFKLLMACDQTTVLPAKILSGLLYLGIGAISNPKVAADAERLDQALVKVRTCEQGIALYESIKEVGQKYQIDFEQYFATQNGQKDLAETIANLRQGAGR